MIFEHFGGQKLFLYFFKVILDLFGKCLGFVFGLKRPAFECTSSSNCQLMKLKIKNFRQNLTDGSFLTISKVKRRQIMPT